MKEVIRYSILLVILGVIVTCEKDKSSSKKVEDETKIKEEIKAEKISSAMGGSIEMESGIKIEFPSNALSVDKNITVEIIDPTLDENEEKIADGLKGAKVSALVRCGPDGTTFKYPVQLTIPYYSKLFPKEYPVDSIVVVSYSGDSIELLPFVIDKASETVTAEAMHFSDIVILSTNGILIFEGKIYNTVIINGKEWMAENFAYLPQVSPPTTQSTTEPLYYVLGYHGTSIEDAKATDSYSRYGALYNWSSALEACPDGWHIPSKDEWGGWCSNDDGAPRGEDFAWYMGITDLIYAEIFLTHISDGIKEGAASVRYLRD